MSVFIPCIHITELCVADRKMKREIRHLENELPKWQVLVDTVTGISPPDFDNQTLAVLRGRLVRYLMRSREVIHFALTFKLITNRI